MVCFGASEFISFSVKPKPGDLQLLCAVYVTSIEEKFCDKIWFLMIFIH